MLFFLGKQNRNKIDFTGLSKRIDFIFFLKGAFCLRTRWHLTLTWSRVLMTSAGVTSEAAGIPAMAPETSNESGEL
jgi:hypothetical protein